MHNSSNRLAADIFRNLHEEIMNTSSRGLGVMLRIRQLETELPLMEKSILAQPMYSHFSYSEGMAFVICNNSPDCMHTACCNQVQNWMVVHEEISFFRTILKFDHCSSWKPYMFQCIMACIILKGVEWHGDHQIGQNLVTVVEMPSFVMNSYKECRGPPKLFMLDKYKTKLNCPCYTLWWRYI